jgi:hypothetical protein
VKGAMGYCIQDPEPTLLLSLQEPHTPVPHSEPLARASGQTSGSGAGGGGPCCSWPGPRPFGEVYSGQEPFLLPSRAPHP